MFKTFMTFLEKTFLVAPLKGRKRIESFSLAPVALAGGPLADDFEDVSRRDAARDQQEGSIGEAEKIMMEGRGFESR